jgi:gliding motility-associated-like protein
MKTILPSLIICLHLTTSYSQDYQDDCLDSMEIQSTVTMDGDGINDDFSFRFECPPEEFEISIYNRWGVEIFSSEDAEFTWIGRDKDDKLVSEGTYIYRFKYTFKDSEVSRTGNFSLIK